MIYKFEKEFGGEPIEVEANTYQHAMRRLRLQFVECGESEMTRN
jgi:hypothetical protein